MQRIKDLVHERLPVKTDEMERFPLENEILVSRMKDVRMINAEDAIRYSITGPDTARRRCAV
jgi:NADH:ubiquinone oxidoreductase subunit D